MRLFLSNYKVVLRILHIKEKFYHLLRVRSHFPNLATMDGYKWVKVTPYLPISSYLFAFLKNYQVKLAQSTPVNDHFPNVQYSYVLYTLSSFDKKINSEISYHCILLLKEDIYQSYIFSTFIYSSWGSVWWVHGDIYWGK